MPRARPWYKRFPKDYRDKTVGLSLEQHGAYNILLDTAWERYDTALPNDEPWLRSLFPGLHGRSFNAHVRPVLERFWTLGDDDKWRNKRLDEEAESASKLSRTQAENVSKRYRNRNETVPKPPNGSSDINDLALTVVTPARSGEMKNKKKKKSKKEKALPPVAPPPFDWQPSVESFEKARAEYRLTRSEIEGLTQRVVDYFCNHERGRKNLRADYNLTFLNWSRKLRDEKPRPTVPGGYTPLPPTP